MAEGLRISTEDAVARITLDRPPLNVMNTAMMSDLADTLDRVSRLAGVRLVRIDAEGKAFSAGVDVGEHMGESLEGMMAALGSLFAALEAVPQPTIAVVQGAALGGGCELALGTDLCICSRRASFGLPEIRLGVFAPPASVLLPRLVGQRRALGILLSGETIDAVEAERIGLVNAVLPVEEFETKADEWVGRFLELSGTALRLAKRAVTTAGESGVMDAHRAVTRLYMSELMNTADAAEGLRSFVEKRPPVWKHR